MSLDQQEVSAPIQRGLSALSKLNIEDTRTSDGLNGFYHGLNDGTTIDEQGALKLHRNSIATPTNSDIFGIDDEHSPYSVLNTILWGHTRGRSS